ncbi:hypothetical protein [Nocardioides plantarum]|uniref:Uncharacterized protein n=1 Tax=Nocardioides plantarum TaxID=29299 RepID=A0ABV5K9R7_9ACTN|nr:hypothetical protein [Nocardioides plantarum]
MADFFSELHRRHPDVDLVVLPPSPPPADVPEAGDDEVAAAFSNVARATRQVWSTMAPASAAEPRIRWSYAADPGRVHPVGRVVERRSDGSHLLVGLRHDLESHGWAVTRPAGVVERLAGRLDDLTLTASYAEPSGALVLTVSHEPLVVGPDRAVALVRPARPARPTAVGGER